ncbi:uncharacterized protein LOC134179838 [Corticium candelabrum]|uniref:uncharacterized protein LOC134179838 n=1 Tax=Corticium candelabrum TaxID=121492 RepID=UPI002E26674C|nr:uncharacterized protein LOC134179838 [Corticium candelabrum]
MSVTRGIYLALSLLLLCCPLDAANMNTCASLGLLSGGNPTEFMWTEYSGNSPQTSSITWSSNGTRLTSYTSTVSCTDEVDTLLIRSNGIPAHNIGKFPMTTMTTGALGRNGQPRIDNPNSLTAQTYNWRIPKMPTKKTNTPQSVITDFSALQMGPIGFALNGVPFFNPYNAQRLDAVSRNSSGFEVMGLCHGHPTDRGAYHYHFQTPTDGCLFGENGAQIVYNSSERSPKIGYAFDGIPIYGPLTSGGVRPTDLDACNGRDDAELNMYVYHITEFTEPYIIGCYRYVAATTGGQPPMRSTDSPMATGDAGRSTQGVQATGPGANPTAGAQGNSVLHFCVLSMIIVLSTLFIAM